MSKLEEIKNDYLTGEMFGNQWCSTPKSSFEWLIEQAEKVEKLQKELDIYSEAIGDIEHAMHKVGWNNTRIEEAFDEMNDKLKSL